MELITRAVLTHKIMVVSIDFKQSRTGLIAIQVKPQYLNC